MMSIKLNVIKSSFFIYKLIENLQIVTFIISNIIQVYILYNIQKFLIQIIKILIDKFRLKYLIVF